MKKLIKDEVISVILVIGVFLLVFTLLGGWEKADRERYEIAVISAAFASLVVFVFVVAVAVFTVVNFVAGIIGITEKIKRIDASKKVIWFFLGVEAVAIIFPVFFITFY